MKIYPGNHQIVSSEEVTMNHIPLSYFDEKESIFNPNIKINPSFCGKNINQRIYPFQSFDDDSILFFDKNRKAIKDSSLYLKRNGNKYYFEPKESVEFIPQKFTYSILLEKADRYKNNVKYNIKIGSSSLTLAEKLIGFFSSENYSRPNNININNNDILPSSMINVNINNLDFFFTEKAFLDDNIEVINNALNHHTNIWITCNEWDELIIKDKNIKSYIIDNPEIYGKQSYIPEEENKIRFDVNYDIKEFPQKDFDYINLFTEYCPILVLKKEEGAFVIISHSSLFEDISQNYKVVYEILNKVYLNSYFETNNRSSYIANNKIDYYIKVNKKFNQYHPLINLKNILYEDSYNLNINYNLIKINYPSESDKKNIVFKGIDNLNNLFFESSKDNDPKKDDNVISVFTNKDTIIYYDLNKNDFYVVEDNIKINNKRIDDENYLIIYPYKSSLKHIDIEKEQSIKIKDSSKYSLVYAEENKKFSLVSYNENNQNEENIAAIIQFETVNSINCKDIRKIGGGESSSKLNYDMIDTGSLKGRPYRIGSTLIIKLPERFREQKDNIMSEIKKHISSADYPIIIFENR